MYILAQIFFLSRLSATDRLGSARSVASAASAASLSPSAGSAAPMDLFRAANDNKKEKISICCVDLNTRYLVRVTLRFFTALYRLLLFLLIWRIIGGAWLIAIIFWEFSFHFGIYYVSKELIFMEAFMGFVWQKISIKNVEVDKIWRDDDNVISTGIIIYQILLGIGGLGLLCAMFVLSDTTFNGCCDGMELDTFTIGALVVLILCILPGVIVMIHLLFDVCWFCTDETEENATIFVVFCFMFLRMSILFVFCILFNYSIYFCIMGVDLLFILMYAMTMRRCLCFNKMIINYIVVTFLKFYSQLAMIDTRFLLFGFHFFHSFVYYMLIVFMLIYSKDLNISFVNTYDETVKHFLGDSGSDIDSIIIGLLVFVGVLGIVLPIWTFYLLFKAEIINENVSNDRTLQALSQSGDIYGIIEFMEFGGAGSSGDGGLTDTEVAQYIEKALESHDFKYNRFPHMEFLKQYEIMRHLYDQYNIKLSENYQTQLMDQLNTRPKKLDRFKFKFKDDDKLLRSFLFDCIDTRVTYSQVVSLYQQLKIKPIFDFIVKCARDKKISWESEWRALWESDIVKYEFKQQLVFINAFVTGHSDEFNLQYAEEFVASYFGINWERYALEKRRDFALSICHVSNIIIPIAMQKKYMSSLTVSDAKAIESYSPKWMYSFNGELLAPLYAKLEMKSIGKCFVNYIKTTPINKWNDTLNLSTFPYELIIEIIDNCIIEKNVYHDTCWSDKTIISISRFSILQQCTIMTKLYKAHGVRMGNDEQKAFISKLNASEFIDHYKVSRNRDNGDDDKGKTDDQSEDVIREDDKDVWNVVIDGVATDSKTFLNLFSLQMLPMLYNKLEMKIIHDHFLHLIRTTDVATWDTPIDVSYFTPDLVEDVLKEITLALKTLNPGQKQMIQWVHPVSFDKNQKTDQLLYQFHKYTSVAICLV